MKQLSAISSRVSVAITNASPSPARKLWLLLAISTLLILTMGAGDVIVLPSLLLEQDAARYKTLGHRMMCTCGCEQVLLECNHNRGSLGPCETAIRMRGELSAALQRGDSDESIQHSFAQKYGATVLSPPRIRDLSKLALVAWIVGFILLAVSGSIVIILVRKSHKPDIVIPNPLSELEPIDADMLRRRVRAATENDDWV